MRIFAGMPLGNQTWLDWEISELAMEVIAGKFIEMDNFLGSDACLPI